MEIAEGTLVVVRFGSFAATSLMADAQDDHDERVEKGLPPFYGVSTFGKRVLAAVEEDDLIREICADAPCRSKTVAVLTEAEVRAAGYTLHKTEAVMERERDHHDLVLGTTLRQEDAEAVSALFQSKRRRSPVWKR